MQLLFKFEKNINKTIFFAHIYLVNLLFPKRERFSLEILNFYEFNKK